MPPLRNAIKAAAAGRGSKQAIETSLRKFLHFCNRHGRMRAVNRLHTGRPARLLRAAALFLALIVLGISGGTTLDHSDEMGFARVHAGPSAVTHAAPVQTADTCLACQWENALFSPLVPAVPLPLPTLTPLSVLSFPARTQVCDPFDHTSPRAPPHAS